MTFEPTLRTDGRLEVALDPAAPAATIAENVPEVMLSVLERRYLTDFRASLWELNAAPDDNARPLLREVRGLGRSRAGEDWNQAMPHALTASHSLGQAFVFVIHGDGHRHHLYLGGRRISTARGSTHDFLESQGSAARAHVRGLDLGEIRRLDGDGLPDLVTLLQEAPALAAVTGIPSPRGGLAGPSAFQGIERLVDAVGTHQYALVIVAQPLPPVDLDTTIDRCRRIQTDVHTLIRRTVSQSLSEGTSQSTTTERPDEGKSDLPLYLNALATFCGAAGLALPLLGVTLPPGAMSSMAQSAMVTAMGLSRARERTPRTTDTAGTSRTSARGVTAELLDANAEACDALLRRHLTRLQAARSQGWWRTGVYVAAESDAALEAVTGALRGICSGEATQLDPLRVIRTAPWLVRSAALRGQVLLSRSHADDTIHPLGPSFDALATCLSSDELAILVNLPRRGLPGLELRDVGDFAVTAAPPAEDAVRLGTLRDALGRDLGPVTVDGPSLNRHVFITGMTGYGKTTTAKNLLVEAATALDVPFLVVEPVKSEYRELVREPRLGGRLRVFGIGEDDTRRGVLPLRLNPFMPVENVPMARHIDLLKAVFNAAFPMFAGMSYILEEAMLEVYQDRGWDVYSPSNVLLGPYPAADDLNALVPTVGDLYQKIEEVLDRRRYGPEVHQNMGAALRSRLQSLMLGTKGTALNSRRAVPARELFAEPCVIELRNLGDDEEKSFVMALLLCQLYEFAEARHTTAPRDGLRHLTLIEEAHRLLRAARSPAGPETPDAQAKAVTMFTDMLAEMRAYGEGFVVADQIPTKLAPEVLKNSNLKIIHRLVSPDDQLAAGATVNLTDGQRAHLGSLPPGVAVVHDGRIGSAVLVGMTQLQNVAPDPAAASADPPDRSYLFLHSGCARCSSPCKFFPRTRRAGTPGATSGRDLEPFFRHVLLGDLDAALRIWTTWRASWAGWAGHDDAEGLAYCASVQAGHAWLEALLRARRTAVGLAGLDATALLRLDRAAREIGELVHAHRGATHLDGDLRDRIATRRQALLALLEERPPRELPGCANCPVRCRMLSLVAPALTAGSELRSAVAARATAATPPDTTMRSVTAAADPLLRSVDTSLTTPADRAGLLYCLVVAATAPPLGTPTSDAPQPQILAELHARAAMPDRTGRAGPAEDSSQLSERDSSLHESAMTTTAESS